MKRKRQVSAADSLIMWRPTAALNPLLTPHPFICIDQGGGCARRCLSLDDPVKINWDACAWLLKVLDKTIEYVEADMAGRHGDIHIIDGLEQAAEPELPPFVELTRTECWIREEIDNIEWLQRSREIDVSHIFADIHTQVHGEYWGSLVEVYEFAWLYQDAWKALQDISLRTPAWYQANLNCKRYYIGLVHWESAKNGFEQALAALDKHFLDEFYKCYLGAHALIEIVPSCQDFARLLQPHEVIH